MADDYQKIRDDRARTDVYGRRIGRPSTCTNRMLYKPPPNFTIQQLRKYKKRKVKETLLLEAGINHTKHQVKQLLLQSDNIRAFNKITHVESALKVKKRRPKFAFEKPNRSHTQDCKELRTVVDKFRDDYYYKPTGEKLKHAHFPEATSWFKGQWVECLHKNRWMPGQIAAINMSQSGSDPQGHLTFNVRYPWGDPGVDLNVSERNIRWMPPKRHWYKGEPVVVNWEGRGNWYTASVVKVHRDGSNSVDVKFDDGRTVGCVNGPRYVTRVVQEMVQEVKWYVGQPILAQYRGRGLWYRAHVIRVDHTPKKHIRLSTEILMGAKDGEDENNVDDEECTVMVQYDGLGGGEATETDVNRLYLRPWLGDWVSDLAMPVLQSENFGSSIESVFVPSLAEPGSIDLAWFWGQRSDLLRDSNDSMNSSIKKRVLQWTIPKRQPKLGTDGVVAPLRAVPLGTAAEEYSLDGHVRISKTESVEDKRKRLKKLKQAKLLRIESKSNAAITAAASPDQLVKLKRKGPGLEKATIRMKHSDLGSSGLVLQKFVNSIEGVGYREGKQIIKMYVTVRPGSYESLSTKLLSLSGGTASIAMATDLVKQVHFSSSTIAPFLKLKLSDLSKNSKDSSLLSLSLSEQSHTHTEIVTFLNWCRRGETRKMKKWLKGAAGLVNPKTGMNPLLAAVLGNHLSTAKLLIKAGCDPMTCDHSGRCANELAKENLLHAEENEDIQLWQEFVGIFCLSSVHEAARTGNVPRLRYLETKTSKRKRNHGRWLSKANRYGVTPLHLAIMNGHLKTAQWIDRRVESTAWRVANRVGQTPDDLCVSAPNYSDAFCKMANARK